MNITPTGLLSFISLPDFENPTDSDKNNTYEVIVTASDGNLTDSQLLSVSVTDVYEAPSNSPPVIKSNGGGDRVFIQINENTSLVTSVQATDPDADALTYYISGGLDASKFNIHSTTGLLSFLSLPDFENPQDVNRTNIPGHHLGI